MACMLMTSARSSRAVTESSVVTGIAPPRYWYSSPLPSITKVISPALCSEAVTTSRSDTPRRSLCQG